KKQHGLNVHDHLHAHDPTTSLPNDGARQLQARVRRQSVRKIIWPQANMIGGWVLIELNGLDRRPALQRRLGDAMSPVHYLPARRQDNRECEVGLLD
ncbi:MAG TPA: hypothetical protein VK845_01650, partial [Gemmatimonadales bacterium]|nr:hypothetical protein [Gemmatimonadales bacterium]